MTTRRLGSKRYKGESIMSASGYDDAKQAVAGHVTTEPTPMTDTKFVHPWAVDLESLKELALEDADPSGCVPVDSDDLIELIAAYREREQLHKERIARLLVIADVGKLPAHWRKQGLHVRATELERALFGLGVPCADTGELEKERDELRQRIEHAESALVRISDLCASGLQATKEKRT